MADPEAMLARYRALTERMKRFRPRFEALRDRKGWINVLTVLPLLNQASAILMQMDAAARHLQRVGPSMPGAELLLAAAERAVPVIEGILSKLEALKVSND